MTHPSEPWVSVVIPALNEAGNIGRLIAETYAAIPPRMLREVIIVDDGSDDGTGREVQLQGKTFANLRCLRHTKRCGQSAAVRTGILSAAGSVIATMDGDGQNDPADIAKLVDALAPLGSGGPEFAGGVRTVRKDTGSKRLASRLANAIRDFVLRDDCPDSGCGIKAFHRDIYLRLPFFDGMHRYMPALFLSYGCKVAYLPVNDRPRIAGKSKYTNLGRALIGIYDLVGVRWLRSRTMVPEVLPERDGAVAPSPGEAGGARPPHVSNFNTTEAIRC